MSIAAIIGLYRLSYLHRALKRTGVTGRQAWRHHEGFNIGPTARQVFRSAFGYRDGREPQQPISQGWVPAGRSAGDDPDRAIVPMRSRASRRTPPATAGGASTGADIGSGSVETGTMQS